MLGSSASGQLDRLLLPVENQPKAERPQVPVATVPPVESEKTSLKVRDSSLFTGSDLLRELKGQITEHFSLSGDLVLDLSRPWTTIKLPSSDVAVTVTDYPREGVSSSFLIRCKIVSDGQVVGEWQIPLRARLWQEVWVATVRLDRGQVLDDSMVTAQKVDVLLNRGALLGAEGNPSAYEIAQSVSVGQPLTKRDVIEKPVIRKNQIVEVVANRGALAISMKALALENGAANALIKMRNLDSRREFNAQVVDESHVHVLF